MGGWWGIAFVVLLFSSAAMASLPTAADSDTAIAAFYRSHTTIVVLQQAIGALALVAFVIFALALNPNRWLMPVVYAFVAVELLTNIIPLVAIGVQGEWRQLTVAEDFADAVLFITAAAFAVVATLDEPLWLRLIAYLVTAACVLRAVLGFSGATSLDLVAPLTLIAFVLVLSIRLLVRPASVIGEQTAAR
jgi:hypothetical protein